MSQKSGGESVAAATKKSEYLEADLSYILQAMKNCGCAKDEEETASLCARKEMERRRVVKQSEEKFPKRTHSGPRMKAVRC